ncbi:HlyD family secretion protein [Inquilinus sp. CAU 1745]|uniref:HlyD family secretion protein n=1 Tax=Inquilinus sp. CAU 1745 TaxID=3140369 RepID=UPI00325A6021
MPDTSTPETLPEAGTTSPIPPPRPRRRKRLALLLAGPLLALAVGGYLWLTSGRYIATENAYLQADMIMVSADVSGRTVEIAVSENQPVEAGDTLFRIDPLPFEIALREAAAKVASARAEMAALKAEHTQVEATLVNAEETVAYASSEFERQQRLRAEGVNSQSALDDARHVLRQAESRLAVARAELASIVARLGGDPETPIEELPAVLAAEAARDQAALDLRHATITAPTDGIASNVDLQVGEYIQASEPAFALLAAETPWVEANLKETDLTHLAVGQEAEIVVDAYPDRTFHAHVASISPATGAEFSILPAQNASGNWVKVVQRVPVRLAFDDAQAAVVLRSGMSVEVTIDTGSTHRQTPEIVSSALAFAGVGS